MKPLRLILSDWCQHVSRDIVFSEGLNAIMGANGSGKTNILEAINLCLSLDTNNPGKKTDGIRNGCEKASVGLVFEHEGIEGRITVKLKRNYRTSWDELSAEIEMARRAVEINAADPSQPVTQEQLALQAFKPVERVTFELEWADVKCRNATEVAEFIRSHTGLDPKTIRTNYFPRQGDVDGAMSADREVRQRIFHEKAGTALCQKVWDELGKAQRAIPDFSTAEQALRDTEARLALTKAEHLEVSKRHADLMEQPIDIEGPQEIVRRYMTVINNKQALGQAQQELNEAAVARENARVYAVGIENNGVTARSIFDALEPQVEEWQKQVWEQEQAAKSKIRREEMRRELSEATTAFEAMPVRPTSETPLERVSALREEAAQLRQTADQLDRWLATFASGVCPTCGQAVGQEVVETHKATRASLPDPAAVAQQANTLEQQYRAEQAALAEWDLQRQRLEMSVASLTEQLNALPEIQVADVSAAKQGLEEFAEAKRNLETLRAKHAESVQAYNQAKEEHAKKTSQVEQLMSVDGQECPTEEEFKQAGEAVTAAQFVQQQIRDVELELGVLERRLKDLEEERETRAAEAAKCEPSRKWSELLSQARELFHQNNLPLQVVAWYAEQLAAHTQKGLDNFEAGFQLAVSPELDLLGVFPDKIMISVRFSGGEKNMTNICMRLGMQSLFPSDLQLLVLDEVEVHLDQDKVSKLPIILESVKNMARERGLVVLFISHHPSLVGISDRTIHVD